jgi:holo-[acyl-carrier protein] synthase
MIKGIGIDSVQISRIAVWLEKPSLLKRFFHPQEHQEAMSRGPGALRSLAARFAAKEAFGKALGRGLYDLHLKEICVENDPKMGKPFLKVEGVDQRGVRTPGRGQAAPLHHPRRGYCPGLCGMGGINAEKNIILFQKRDPMSCL